MLFVSKRKKYRIMVKSDLQTLMRQFEGYLYDCTREIRYWFIAIRVTRRTFGMLYNTCAH